MEDVGSYLRYKFDLQHFRRHTRNASEDTIKEYQFADNVALLATTREGAETTARAYSCVAKTMGLTVNIIKTKFMVVSHDIAEKDMQPISLEGGEIEHVSEFPYLGSSIATNGRIDDKIDMQIANASKTFGVLRQAVFKNANLSITTKRLVYQPCVLSVLLYGEEYWIPLKKHQKRLNTFHHHCTHTILGITCTQQWEEHIPPG